MNSQGLPLEVIIDSVLKRFQHIVRKPPLLSPIQKIKRLAEGKEDAYAVAFNHSIKVSGPGAYDLMGHVSVAVLSDSIGADTTQGEEQYWNVEKSRQRRSRLFAVLTYCEYAPRVKKAAALLDELF
jgi:hypothetical protein